MPHPLDGAIIRAVRAEEHTHDLGRRIDDLGRLYSEAALSKIDLDALNPSHLFIHEGQLLGAADALQLDKVLGGHLKTGQLWTGQNRPVREPPQARVFYRVRS